MHFVFVFTNSPASKHPSTRRYSMSFQYDINLELYKVFYIASLSGSMTKAAKKLFMGQPSVSKAIQSLETKLGVVLFERSPKGLTLTNEGAVLFEHISQAMEQIKLAEDSIENMKHQFDTTILIDVCAMIFKLMIMPQLKSFFKIYDPQLYEVSPITDSYYSLNLLEKEQIDCCILTKPLDVDNFKFIRLFTFHDYLMASPEYINSVTSAGKSIEKSATLISMMAGNIISKYEQKRLKNISFVNKMKVTSMEHTIALAKMDHGMGFIAEELVKEELATNQLVKIDLPFSPPTREVGFLLNKNSKISPNLQNFIDYYLGLSLNV